MELYYAKWLLLYYCALLNDIREIFFFPRKFIEHSLMGFGLFKKLSKDLLYLCTLNQKKINIRRQQQVPHFKICWTWLAPALCQAILPFHSLVPSAMLSFSGSAVSYVIETSLSHRSFQQEVIALRWFCAKPVHYEGIQISRWLRQSFLLNGWLMVMSDIVIRKKIAYR